MKDNASLPFASTLCGACYDVCPVKIDIPAVLVDLRARIVETKPAYTPEAVAMKTASIAMRGPRRWRLAETALQAGRLVSRKGRIRRLPPPLNKWTRARDLPAPPRHTFRQWWRSR